MKVVIAKELLDSLSKQPKYVIKKVTDFVKRVSELDNDLANEYIRSKSKKIGPPLKGDPQIFVARISQDYRLFYTLDKVDDEQVLIALDVANHDEAFRSWSNRLKEERQ